MALPFSAFGFFLRQHKHALKFKLSPLIVTAIIWVVLAFYNGKIDFVWYQFGKQPILWLVNGILGSCLLMVACHYLKPKYLLYMGENSLTIMCIHQIIMFTCYQIFCGFISSAYTLTLFVMVFTFILTLLLTPIISSIYARIDKSITFI